MADPDDRFDALLGAMLTKPPLDVKPKDEPEDENDLREQEAD